LKHFVDDDISPSFSVKMKGFLVVNRINDVFFIDSDGEFADHINNQAKEQGLIQVMFENI